MLPGSPFGRIGRGLLSLLAGLLLTACGPVVLKQVLIVTPTALPAAPLDASPTLAPTPISTPIPTISIPMLTPTLSATLQTDDFLPLTEALSATEGLPEAGVPDCLGVEIHFTRATGYEYDLLQAGGFRWVRMDLFWGDVERAPGRFDFSAYDSLVRALAARGMGILFILDYGNTLYDSGHPPTSDAGRAAYARFAAAAARHYRDQDVIWEIWNEPNLAQFWYPEPDPAAYGRLALSAIAAIRRVDPLARVVGPALVSFPEDYWRQLAAMGVLSRLDAVSVHPYGLVVPEDVIPHVLWLRRLLDTYSPDRTIPILVSEWGYASVQGGISRETQAQYLLRQALVNLAHDVNLTVWYDWRDDGIDPADVEQNFGTLTHKYAPKPAYRAAQALSVALGGYRFVRRVALTAPDDYLLLFRKQNQVAAAAWTTSEQHSITLALPLQSLPLVDMYGEASLLSGAGSVFTLTLSQSPRVLLLGDDDPIRRLALWGPCRSVQHPMHGTAMGVCAVLENPYADPLQAELQVWAADRLLGRTDAAAQPGELTQIWVPIDEAGLSGDVAASLVIAYPDQALPPLQTAPIWLILE